MIGGQLPQAHRASGMELLGGNAHFAPQPKFTAIGKPGGGVDIHRRTVYTGCEFLRRCFVPCDNGLTVAGGMRRNVGDCFLHIFYTGNGKNIVQKFRVKVPVPRSSAGDNALGERI